MSSTQTKITMTLHYFKSELQRSFPFAMWILLSLEGNTKDGCKCSAGRCGEVEIHGGTAACEPRAGVYSTQQQMGGTHDNTQRPFSLDSLLCLGPAEMFWVSESPCSHIQDPLSRNGFMLE